METLLRADDAKLYQFYDALKNTNQNHIVQLMNFKGLQHTFPNSLKMCWFLCKKKQRPSSKTRPQHNIITESDGVGSTDEQTGYLLK